MAYSAAAPVMDLEKTTTTMAFGRGRGARPGGRRTPRMGGQDVGHEGELGDDLVSIGGGLW